MGTKTVNKALILFVLCIPFLSLYGQHNDSIFILVKDSDIINLDENYWEKEETKSKIIFSFGLETLHHFVNLIHCKGIHEMEFISQREYKNMSFSKISDLKKKLINSKYFDSPNELFKNIYVVSHYANEISVYEVYWENEFIHDEIIKN